MEQVAEWLLKEGIGVGFLTATAARPTLAKLLLFVALSRAGFRRFATYRQATVAAAATNSMFGFLRGYVLLAATAGAGGTAAGHDKRQLALFVRLGQGLIGVVGFWGWTDLADRIRTGEVVVDLDEPFAGQLEVPGAAVTSVEADGRRVFTVDGAGAGALRDLTVVEPGIEEVIARLYARGLTNP